MIITVFVSSIISDCLSTPIQSKLETWRKRISILDKEHSKSFKKIKAVVKKKSQAVEKLSKKVKKKTKKTFASKVFFSLLLTPALSFFPCFTSSGRKIVIQY